MKRMNIIYEGIELDAALIGVCSFKALLRACYEAESASVTAKAIRRGFETCGIFPFKANIIKDLVKKNIGISPERTIEGRVKFAVNSIIGEGTKVLTDRGKKLEKE